MIPTGSAAPNGGKSFAHARAGEVLSPGGF